VTLSLMPAGRAVLGGSLVVYVAGLVLGHHELVAVAVVGLVAVALAVVATAPARLIRLDGGAVARTVGPLRATRGDPAEARLRVRREGRTGGWQPTLVLRDLVGGAAHDTVVPRNVGPDGFEARYPLPTTRRGMVPVGPLSVVRGDPLGLAVGARRLGQDAVLWVYPRVYGLVPLASGRQRDLDGPTEDRAAGSITFHALREYVPGDDLRLIHWRSTARTGTLMVRQQVDPSQPHTTVVLDTRRSSYETADGADPEDGFEEAVDGAASLLVASTSRRFPVRLWTTGGLNGGGRSGTIEARPLLDELTVVQLGGDGSLAELAGRLGGEAAGRSVVVITGRPDDDELAVVQAQAHRLATLAVVRFDPATPSGAAWHDGTLDVAAPDSAHFARLWRQVT
jgi:uncharacterized protein (DUF58 family)